MIGSPETTRHYLQPLDRSLPDSLHSTTRHQPNITSTSSKVTSWCAHFVPVLRGGQGLPPADRYSVVAPHLVWSVSSALIVGSSFFCPTQFHHLQPGPRCFLFILFMVTVFRNSQASIMTRVRRSICSFQRRGTHTLRHTECGAEYVLDRPLD